MMKTIKKKLAVVGGGASGLFAAVCAAEKARSQSVPLEITVFEAQNRVGKKLLTTGNGRCNLTNHHFDLSFYFGDRNLLTSIFDLFSPADTLEFFHAHGMLTRSDEEGRVYPRSNQATTVLDLLRDLCDAYRIELRTEAPVLTVRKTSDAFILNGSELFDAVIYAVGSPAGTDRGGTLKPLNELHIGCVPFLPALCSIRLQGFTKSLKGVRAEGKVILYADGARVASDCGEIQYTEQGISGIPTMQISLFASRGVAEKKKMTVLVDALPESTAADLITHLKMQRTAFPHKKIVLVLGGILHKKLGEYLLRDLGVGIETEIRSLSDLQLGKIADNIKKKEYVVAGTGELRSAQAATGGVPAAALRRGTLESVRAPGLFVCGEAVDVTGLCGGYNLQWAWSSGYVAAVSAVRKLST